MDSKTHPRGAGRGRAYGAMRAFGAIFLGGVGAEGVTCPQGHCLLGKLGRSTLDPNEGYKSKTSSTSSVILTLALTVP